MAEIMTENGIREVLSWNEFGDASREIAQMVVDSGFVPDVVVAIARGGLVPGGAVAYALGTKGVGTMNIEFYTDIGETLADPRILPPLMDTQEMSGQRVLVVDDVADSGRTLALVMDILARQGSDARSAVLYTKPRSIIIPDYSWKNTDEWITFPWSDKPPIGSEHSIDA
jgi:hypoxanthine phosphoribosyltransferase